MAVILDRGFKTGVPWQDKQHRELFEKVRELILAAEKGEGEKEVLRLLDFLDEYVVVHFHDEEKAMNDHRFPDALSHMKEHTGFIEDLSRLKSEVAKGVTPRFVDEVKDRVLLWLETHMSGSDKKLGSFLLKKNAYQPGVAPRKHP